MSRLTFCSLAVVVSFVLVCWAVSAPLVVAQAYASSFGKNKVQYCKFDWHIYKAPHFDIYYYTDEQ